MTHPTEESFDAILEKLFEFLGRVFAGFVFVTFVYCIIQVASCLSTKISTY